MRTAVLLLVLGLGACESPHWSAPVSGLDRIVLSVWGSAPNDVWFAGGGLGSGPGALAMHFDGSAFVDLPSGSQATLWWVFGLAPNSVWFCGEKGTLLHWDGMAFQSFSSPTDKTLYGLWGSGPNDLWAVGGEPDASSVLLHFDGLKWATATGAPALGGAYFKVWGSAADDVFVVGQGGTILHFDGMSWSPMASGVGPFVTLLTVAGRARDDVYVVGGLGNGVALHYDGKSWQPVAGLNVGTISALAALAVDATGGVVVGGLAGVKFRRPSGAWLDESRTPPRSSDFHGAWMAGPDNLFLVGGNYIAPAGAPRSGIIAHYGYDLPTARR